VAEIFEAAGIPAEVRSAYIRESAGAVLPWLVQIEANFKDLLGYVVAGAAGAVGAESWTRVRDLIRRLYEARKGSSGGVTLKDPDTRTEISLPPDLTDEAYRRLGEIESLRAPQSGILKWNAEMREWIDPLAGRLRCRYEGCREPASQGRVRQLSPSSMERREFCDSHAAAADLGDDQAWA
jgi:hypothetical protein